MVLKDILVPIEKSMKPHQNKPIWFEYLPPAAFDGDDDVEVARRGIHCTELRPTNRLRIILILEIKNYSKLQPKKYQNIDSPTHGLLHFNDC